MTWSRWLGSPISKVNLLIATRSREVCTDADRMLTCWSDSTRVTSESSRLRSSASTWSCTRKTRRRRSAPTRPRSSAPAGDSRDSALVQSARCTDTPLPRVTKPMIGSPGTGVQQRASLTQTSAVPSTTTPGSPCAAPHRAAIGVVGLGEVLGRALLAAERGHEPAHDVLGGDVALADRGIQGVDVLVAQLGREAGQRSRRVMQPLERQALLAHAPWRSRPCRSRSPPRGAPWRTTAGSCCGPAGA